MGKSVGPQEVAPLVKSKTVRKASRVRRIPRSHRPAFLPEILRAARRKSAPLAVSRTDRDGTYLLSCGAERRVVRLETARVQAVTAERAFLAAPGACIVWAVCTVPGKRRRPIWRYRFLAPGALPESSGKAGRRADPTVEIPASAFGPSLDPDGLLAELFPGLRRRPAAVRRELSLHEAMALVLKECPGRTATLRYLSAEIGRRALCMGKPGDKIEPGEIRARARRFENLFLIVPPSQVRLYENAVFPDSGPESRSS
jgi:hypothetical protein